MRICRRSARISLVLTLALGTIPAVEAQTVAGSPPSSPPADARAKAASEGNAAVERLKQAVSAQKGRATPGPGPSVQPSAELRRRAFDAVRRHAASPQMDARARAAFATGQAGLEAEREAMAAKLGQALGLSAPDMAAVAGAAAPNAVKGWVPVLFASSSMPIPTLRAYAAQLERVGGVLAFRGMPGGLTRVGPMAKLSAEILRIDPGCSGPACVMRSVQLIVDPIVFRLGGVTRVPALAMIPGDPTQPYCERDAASPPIARIVFGDASLSGLLEEYARLGGKEEVRDAQTRLGAR
ncbi:type-F conjugative transfer system pilin assembly protein TrbC [Sphingomonas oligophenolica]|uniref:Type-F conjugative transfer system pilin assembly protein TrbC n=2 Tax=Sphingomonas oligophenolica TaxID=301154 RepID=A0ABU9Y324_9SPHN